MVKAVIFDMDGVIIDSNPVHFKAWINVIKPFGINLVLDDFKDLIGKHSTVVAKHIKEKYGLSPSVLDLVKMKKAKYIELLPIEVELRSNSVDFIDAVRQKYSTAVATSEDAKTTKLVMNKFELNDRFDTIFTSDDINKPKPYPEIYLKTAKALGVEPNECIVVEDTVPGVESAKRAGMKCIAITGSYNKDKLYEADLIIDAFSEINAETISKL